MKVVIDIDKEYYELMKYEVDVCHNDYKPIVLIAEGKPLPKGHGRLIDYGYVVDAIDDWVNAEEYRYTNATDYLRKRVANVPTVIEAESGE